MAKSGESLAVPNRGLRLAMAALVILAGLSLTLDPRIDLSVAALFYDSGRGFVADHAPFLSTARRIGSVLGKILGAAIVAAVIYRLVRRRDAFGIPLKALIFVMVVQLVGPVILVNGILKEYWGRARPAQITEFGGTKHYTPPLIIADQCSHNCSFVSGEASYAYSYLAFGFIPRRRRWRRALFGFGAGFGTVVGLMRIAQGGHFLSDIFFSALLMFAVAWLLNRLIIDPRGLSWLRDATRFIRPAPHGRAGKDS